MKGSTQTNWSHTKRNLLDFFGCDKRIDELTVADAKDFERYLKTVAREMRYGDATKADGLKPATLAKRVANAKQFFQDAVERETDPDAIPSRS